MYIQIVCNYMIDAMFNDLNEGKTICTCINVTTEGQYLEEPT